MSPVNFHEYIGIFEDAQPTEAPISTAPVKSRAQPIGPYIAEAHTQLFPFRFCTEHAPKRQNGVQLSFSQFFLAIVIDKYGMDDDSRLPASFSCAVFSTDVFHSLCWGFLTRIVISHITANKRRTDEKKKSRAGSNSVLTMRAVNQQ